jgi:2-oxo-4-hydroxy-4-carboxy-5-ureidoimidazoline decarboxylase
MLGARPFASLDALIGGSDAAVAAMSPADLEATLAGHPRLGEKAVAWSAQEQAGIADSADDMRLALASGNAEYERRFGHIYLACATGRSAGDLLAFLRERLGNDPDAEWRVVAAELAKINRIRLRKLTGTEAGAEIGGRLGVSGELSAVSTHVLDTARGEPASGIAVRLERVGGADGTGGAELGRGVTDADGRFAGFGVPFLAVGTYRLVFQTAAAAPFFPEVTVTFAADGVRSRYHVPLLLGPYGYTTYRGS